MNTKPKLSRKQRRQQKKIGLLKAHLDHDHDHDHDNDNDNGNDYNAINIKDIGDKENTDSEDIDLDVEGEGAWAVVTGALGPAYSVALTLRRIASAKASLAASAFFSSFAVGLLPRITSQKIVCYGLGSFSSSTTSQIQLAFLLLLVDSLCLSSSSKVVVYAFDPVFTEIDIQVLQHYGISLLDKHLDGTYLAKTPTLFYMPHCEGFLYEALYKANALSNLVVIGNNLNKYSGNKKKYNALVAVLESGQVEILEFPEEQKLGNGNYGVKHHPFNDTCLILPSRN